MVFRRVIWIVLDSLGIGEMPDAAAYGDTGSDTLGNIARRRNRSRHRQGLRPRRLRKRHAATERQQAAYGQAASREDASEKSVLSHNEDSLQADHSSSACLAIEMSPAL